MGNKFLKQVRSIPFRVCILLIFISFSHSFAADSRIGIGFKGGISRLEGDWKKPVLDPAGAFVLSFSPSPYFSLGGEIFYSLLKTSQDGPRINPLFTNSDKFQTMAVPMEVDFQFNFAPYSKINPFGIIGGGALYWDSKYAGSTTMLDGKKQRMYGTVVKAGGGLEFRLANTLSFSLGSDFRYSFSDYLDQKKSGDEKDGIISAWAGLTFYPGANNEDDLDQDHIPAALDLDSQHAEDKNGYMDHDGKPENGVPESAKTNAPVVIHHPVFRAEAHHDLHIKADIFSAAPLRTVAVLYRTKGVKKWNVMQLHLDKGDEYSAVIKGNTISQKGLEYCVVAVDNRLKGIGYSGLPQRPIQVQVVPNSLKWRVAGGIVSALAWGSASYILLRKQHN